MYVCMYVCMYVFMYVCMQAIITLQVGQLYPKFYIIIIYLVAARLLGQVGATTRMLRKYFLLL